MSKNVSLSLLIVLALVVGFAVYPWHRSRALEGEITAARTDRDKVAQQLQTETTALAQIRAEIEGANAEREKLLAQRKAAETKLKDQSEPAARRTAAIVIETPKNAGRATPQAALETFLWAMHANDMKGMADAIAFAPQAIAINQKIFSTLSPEARATFGSAEVMIAAVMSFPNRTAAPRLTITDTPIQNADQAKLSYRLGDNARERTQVFQNTSDGWKILDEGTMLADPSRQMEVARMAEQLAAKIASAKRPQTD